VIVSEQKGVLTEVSNHENKPKNPKIVSSIFGFFGQCFARGEYFNTFYSFLESVSVHH